MIWLTLYVTSALIIIYMIIDISWRAWKRRYFFITSIPNLPWIGSLPFMPKTSHELHKFHFESLVKHNYMYVYWVLFTPVVKLARVEFIEPLLKCKESHKKSFVYDFIADWLGNGVLMSTGSKWKKRRVALTGAFHFTILNDFADIYEKHANRLVDALKAHAGTGKCVEVQWIIGLAMLDVICETSMGTCANALDSPECDYARAVDDAKKLSFTRLSGFISQSQLLFPYTGDGRRYKECVDILHGFTLKVINEKIANRKNLQASDDDQAKDEDGLYGKNKRKVFIDVLFELYDKGEIDVEGIREEVDTFMFAGHDTTSTGLSWILYELGRRPEIQEKVHAEMDEIASLDCSLTEKIRMFKYTECVIKECLRLRPPVPGFARVLEKDTVFNGQVFPRGTVLNVDVIGLHNNPEYWPEPARFDPERFESDVKRHPYCYIPFSAGPRNCIGQKFALRELKVFILVILSTFRLKSIQSPEELEVTRNIVTQSRNGLHIEFEYRNK